MVCIGRSRDNTIAVVTKNRENGDRLIGGSNTHSVLKKLAMRHGLIVDT